jgi:hypothetical protein
MSWSSSLGDGVTTDGSQHTEVGDRGKLEEDGLAWGRYLERSVSRNGTGNSA